MGPQRKKWEDFRPSHRRAIIVLGVVGGLLQAAMLWDLWRRPAEQIRGSKRAWAAASFVRPFGQMAYLRWGRKPPATDDGDAPGPGDVTQAAHPPPWP